MQAIWIIKSLSIVCDCGDNVYSSYGFDNHYDLLTWFCVTNKYLNKLNKNVTFKHKYHSLFNWVIAVQFH